MKSFRLGTASHFPDRQEHPQTQPASAGVPPRPPKKTGRGLYEEPPDGSSVDIPDPMYLNDLARAIRQKPQILVGDLKALGRPTSSWILDFATAAKVARKHGFKPRRIK